MPIMKYVSGQTEGIKWDDRWPCRAGTYRYKPTKEHLTACELMIEQREIMSNGRPRLVVIQPGGVELPLHKVEGQWEQRKHKRKIRAKKKVEA